MAFSSTDLCDFSLAIALRQICQITQSGLIFFKIRLKKLQKIVSAVNSDSKKNLVNQNSTTTWNFNNLKWSHKVLTKQGTKTVQKLNYGVTLDSETCLWHICVAMLSLVDEGWYRLTAVLNFCVFNSVNLPKKNLNSTQIVLGFPIR